MTWLVTSRTEAHWDHSGFPRDWDPQSTVFHYCYQRKGNGDWVVTNSQCSLHTNWERIRTSWPCHLMPPPWFLEMKSKYCTLWLKIRHPLVLREKPILSASYISNVLKCHLLKAEENCQWKELNFLFICKSMFPPQNSIYVIMTLVWRIWMEICIKLGPGAMLSKCLTCTWCSCGLPEVTLLRTKERSIPKICSNFWVLKSKILVFFMPLVISGPLHFATQSRKCCRENAWHLCLDFKTFF